MAYPIQREREEHRRPLIWQRWSKIEVHPCQLSVACAEGRLRPFNLSSSRRVYFDFLREKVAVCGWAEKCEKGSIINSELTWIAPTVSILHHSIVLGDISFAIHHCLSIYVFHFNFFPLFLFSFTPYFLFSLFWPSLLLPRLSVESLEKTQFNKFPPTEKKVSYFFTSRCWALDSDGLKLHDLIILGKFPFIWK